MHDTQTRVNLALKRASKIKKRQQMGLIVTFSVMCCAIFALDVGFMSFANGPSYYQTPQGWGYATMLLFGDAGSYVFVAFVAFAVAILLTILGVRMHEKLKQKKKNYYNEGGI